MARSIVLSGDPRSTSYSDPPCGQMAGDHHGLERGLVAVGKGAAALEGLMQFEAARYAMIEA